MGTTGHSDDDVDAVIRAMARDIVDAVHPEEIVLFGSRARGASGQDSDVDLLVVLPDAAISGRRRQVSGDLYRRLMAYPVSKDLLVCGRTEVERWRHVRGHVIEAGLREGRRLYART